MTAPTVDVQQLAANIQTLVNWTQVINGTLRDIHDKLGSFALTLELMHGMSVKHDPEGSMSGGTVHLTGAAPPTGTATVSRSGTAPPTAAPKPSTLSVSTAVKAEPTTETMTAAAPPTTPTPAMPPKDEPEAPVIKPDDTVKGEATATGSGTAPPTATDVAAATAASGTGPSATGNNHREVAKSTPSTLKDIKVNIHVIQDDITAIPSVSLQKKVMEWNTVDMLNQEPLPVDNRVELGNHITETWYRYRGCRWQKLVAI